MGRVRVTEKGKRKKNIPVTRIGKKQYKKRRFAAEHSLEVAGHDNELTRDIMFRDNEQATSLQHYTRVGLTVDPSKTIGNTDQAKAEVRRQKDRLKSIKRRKLPEPEPEVPSLGRPISELEGTMIANLMLKYGTQFKRMSLDYKLNPFQLTPAQLQKKVANYLKFERAAFPNEYAEMKEKGILMDDPAMLQSCRRKRPEDLDEKEE